MKTAFYRSGYRRGIGPCLGLSEKGGDRVHSGSIHRETGEGRAWKFLRDHEGKWFTPLQIHDGCDQMLNVTTYLSSVRKQVAELEGWEFEDRMIGKRMHYRAVRIRQPVQMALGV